MRSVEIEGGSIDDAIARALRALGASRDQVEIDILENATRGLLGLGRRRARVRATIRAPFILASEPTPVSAAAPASTAISDGAPPLTTRSAATPTTAPDAEFDVAAFLAGALQRMGVTARVRAAAVVNGACALAIDGDDPQVLATCTSQVVGALELLVNRVADRHMTERTRFAIVLEGRTGGDVSRRAHRAAERVRQHRRPVTIDVANEHEQQAWTKALDAERGVHVQPTSDGARRKLIIVPEGRRRGGGTADN